MLLSFTSSKISLPDYGILASVAKAVWLLKFVLAVIPPGASNASWADLEWAGEALTRE